MQRHTCDFNIIYHVIKDQMVFNFGIKQLHVVFNINTHTDILIMLCVCVCDSGLITPGGFSSVPAGMETPELIELRKKKIEEAMDG